MVYEVLHQWDLFSNLYVEIKTSQLAPHVNTSSILRFKNIKFYAENVVELEMAFLTTYYPDQSIDQYQIMADYYIAFKTTEKLQWSNIYTEESLNMLAEVYEEAVKRIFDELQIKIAIAVEDWTIVLYEPIKRQDSISAIESALRAYKPLQD